MKWFFLLSTDHWAWRLDSKRLIILSAMLNNNFEIYWGNIWLRFTMLRLEQIPEGWLPALDEDRVKTCDLIL